MSKNLVLKELARRKQAKETHKEFLLEDYCFDKQLAFIRDTSKYKTAVCSRRAGKTVSCAADLMFTALSLPGDVAYITLNRITAKRIIWRELLKINEIYNLGAQPDNGELTLRMPNGNMIYVSGAKDAAEIEKFRGLALRKVYIDETQSFRAYISELIDDVIDPALTDYDGSLILIGTPGPVPAGYFYEATHSDGWAHHSWTMHDNPWIQTKSGKSAEQIIEERCARRGVTNTDPSIRREYYGEWVKDDDSLVYHFNFVKNVYKNLPDDLTYILGIDIGWRDADAIAVIGYNHEGQVFLVEEHLDRKQNITELVNKIVVLQERYKPVRMVMDAGALGKKIQEEIKFRHQLPIEAATKERKLEFIALLNDDLRTGKFKAYLGSRFAEDANLVTWDWDDPAKPRISDRYHTDIGDAVLYGWREAKHYIEQTKTKVVKPGTAEYMDYLEEQEAEAMERQVNGEDGLEVDQNELESLFEGGFDD